MIKKTILLFIFFIIISCKYELNPKVENATLRISNRNTILVDFISETSDYKNLMMVASTEDLVHLTNHESPNVRFYSFIGLMERNYPKINEIYDSHKSDSVNVWVSNGACLKNELPLNALMKEALSPH